MDALWFAGCCDQIKLCIKDIENLLPADVLIWASTQNVQVSSGAGHPELAKRWGICKLAVEKLAHNYNENKANSTNQNCPEAFLGTLQ